MSKGLRRVLTFAALAVLALAALFVVGGYLAVPGLVKSQGQAWVAKNLKNKSLAMGKVGFDPWSLTVDIDDLVIADTRAPADPLVKIAHLTVDASISSLWHLYPRLDRVAVTEPVVDAVLRRDGSLNLLELMPPDDGSPTPEVWIGDLGVARGTVHFTDLRAKAPLKKSLIPLTFTLKDFATRQNGDGGYHLDARSDAGEAFAWDGNLGMAPLMSKGRFKVTALQLASIGNFAGDMLPVKLEAGTLDVAGSYDFATPPAAEGAKPKSPPPPAFAADITSLALTGVALTAPTGDHVRIDTVKLAPTQMSLAADKATLGALSVAGVAVKRPTGEQLAIASLALEPTSYAIKAGAADIGALTVGDLTASLATGQTARLASLTVGPSHAVVADKAADIGAVAANGLAVTGRGKGAGAITLAGLTVAPSKISAANQTATIGAVAATGLRAAAQASPDKGVVIPGLYPLALPKSPPSKDPPWSASLAGFTLSDARLAMDVVTPGHRQTLALSPVDLRVGPVDSTMAKPVDLDLRMVVDGKGKVAVKGSASPKTMGADLAVDVAGLPLPELAALGPPQPVIVDSGDLSVKGRLKVVSGRKGPQPDFAGNVGIHNINLLARTDSSELLRWKQLDLTGLRYQAAPQKLAIAKVHFIEPVTYVVVSAQQTINVMQVSGNAAAAAPGEVTEAATADAATPAAVTEAAAPAKGALAVEEAATAAHTVVTDGKGNGVTIRAPISSTAAAVGSMIPTTIGEVRFDRGTVGFQDNSVEPNFAARIEGFEGTVRGLSTAPGSQATFDLKGYVIDRFSPVTVTGKANPFAYDQATDIAVKFSNIELPVFNPYSGKYAGYAIAKGKLFTEFHYKIDKRKLDAQHHIKIDQLQWGEATASKDKVPLPVRLATSLLKDSNGVIDLDLPVGGSLDDPKFRIWPVVWKVVGNLIGKIVTAPFKLIGGLFAGSEKAQFVAFAPGSAALPADAKSALEALGKSLAAKPELNLDIPAGSGIREDADALGQQRMAEAAMGKQGGDYAGLADDKKVDRLKPLYKAKFGKSPDFPKGEVKEANFLAGGAAKHEAAASQRQWLEAQLKPKFEPTDAQLAELGQARAAAVKEALLAAGGIDPGRVFISTAKSFQAKDGKVEMELGVK